MTIVELGQSDVQLEKLVEDAKAGTEVVITQDGKPVARLIATAAEESADRVPGSAKGLFTVPEDFDAPIEDFKDYI